MKRFIVLSILSLGFGLAQACENQSPSAKPTLQGNQSGASHNSAMPNDTQSDQSDDAQSVNSQSSDDESIQSDKSPEANVSSNDDIQIETIYEHFRQLLPTIPTFRTLYKEGKIEIEPVKNGAPKNDDDYRKYRLVTLAQFNKVLDEFFKTMRACLADEKSWCGPNRELQELLNPKSDQFVPYSQKLFLNPGSLIIIRGDCHGDLHSFMAFIQHLQNSGITGKANPLKIIDPKATIIFEGDYVDRGLWGTEVLTLVMLLKIFNPDQFFATRGNHEDAEIASIYGFRKEFIQKFVNGDTSLMDVIATYEKIDKLYNYLSLVLYFGSGTPTKKKFMQCSHGAPDLGYNPKGLLNAPDEKKFQWIEEFKRADECHNYEGYGVSHPDVNNATVPLQKLCKNFIPISPSKPELILLQWGDFVVDRKDSCCFSKTRGIAINKKLTRAIMRASSTEQAELFGVVRAHQHVARNDDPLMKKMLAEHGCASMWKKRKESETIPVKKGMVLTLLLSPDSYYGTPGVANTDYVGFDYDISVWIITAAELKDWKIKVVNNQIYTKN